MRYNRSSCFEFALLATLFASGVGCTVSSNDDDDPEGNAGDGGEISVQAGSGGTSGSGGSQSDAGQSGASVSDAGEGGVQGGRDGAGGTSELTGGTAGSPSAGAAGETATACGDIDEDGVCDGDVLSFCRDDVLETRDCAGVGMVCTVNAGQADCTEQEDRALACGDLTELGTCDGSMLRYCDETGAVGVARSINCAAYGQDCEPTGAPGDGGAYCVPFGSCGAVDEDGVCSDNSLSFCEDNQLYIFDCGVDECRAISGFSDCFVAGIDDGCGSVTAEGECNDNEVMRCLGNVVTREDCETLGLECGVYEGVAQCMRGECPATCPDDYSCTGGLCVADDEPEAEWTIAVYQVGDNNLSDALWQDLNEIEWVGSDENVRIVVQTEFSPDYSTQIPTGYRSGTYRMLVEQDQDITSSANLEDADELGNLNMGASSTLSDFLRWTAENYPAKKMGLILSNHGLGYQGGFYDTTSGQLLDLREMVAGVRDSGVHLNLLGMDACMMGMHEVGLAFRGVADLMVASEEVEPGSGYPYHEILAELQLSPTMTAPQLGEVVVNDYVNGFLDPTRQRAVTMASIDLVGLSSLNEQLASFAETVLREAPNARSAIKAAVSSDQLMRSKTPNITDIGSILDVFGDIGGAVGTSAEDTRTWFNGSGVVPSARGTYAKEGTSGLAIYFPEAAWSGGTDTYGYYYTGTSFLPLQPWYSLVGNLSSNEAEVATPGEGAIDMFSVVLSWGDTISSVVSNADLDLYVYEPNGDYATPANGSTTVNGLLSADSYDSEIPVESYTLQSNHQTGTYLILVSLYDIPTNEQAFPRLQIYRDDLPGGSRTLLRGKIVDRELVEIPMDASSLLTETITPENFQGVLDLEYSNIWYATTIEVE